MATDVTMNETKARRKMDEDERRQLTGKITAQLLSNRTAAEKLKLGKERLEALLDQYKAGTVEEDVQPELPLDIERPEQPPLDPVEAIE